MTTGCADCSKCGKCYPKVRPCPICGETVNFSIDVECAHCGSPITEQMKEDAKAEYRLQKKEEFERLFSIFRKASTN